MRLICVLLLYTGLSHGQDHNGVPRHLAEPVGPFEPEKVSMEQTGVILYSALGSGNQRLLDELTLKAAVLAEAKKALPNYSPQLYRFIAAEYYETYLHQQAFLNPFSDLTRLKEWAVGKAPTMKPADFTSIERFIQSFNLKEMGELAGYAGVFMRDGQPPPGPALMKANTERWASFENRQKLARNILTITSDPALKEALAPLLNQVVKGDVMGEHSQFMNQNQAAANTMAVRMIREKMEEKSRPDAHEKKAMDFNTARQIDRQEHAAITAMLADIRVLMERSKEANDIIIEGEKRRKAKEDMENVTAPIEAAALTATVLFPSSKEVMAVAMVTDAACKIANLTAVALNPAAFFNSYATVLNLVTNLISLFGNQKSDTQLILEAIADLKHQIEDLHKAMDAQFYDQRQKLDHVMLMMNRQFDRLERRLTGATENLEGRIDHVERLAKLELDFLRQLGEDNRLRELERRQLETESICQDLRCEFWDISQIGGMAHTPEQGERRFGEGNPVFMDSWNAKMGTLYLKGAVGSRSYLMAGTPLRVTGEGFRAPGQPDFYHNMNRQAWFKLTDTVPGGELASLLTIARALSIPIDTGPAIPHRNGNITDTLPIANQRDFIVHASQFLKMAQQWNGVRYPNLYDRWDVNLADLSELIDIGHNTRHAMMSILPLDTENRPSLLTVQKLAANYESELFHLQQAIKERQQVFVAQFGIGGYDAFKSLEQLNPQPGLSLEEPIFRGRLKPCEGYTPVDQYGHALDKNKVELPISAAMEAKFKAAIDKNVFIAADTLGGVISFCYRDLGPETVRREFHSDPDMPVNAIDEERYSQMAITIEGSFTSPRIEQALTIFKRRIRDPNVVNWTHIDWDPLTTASNEPFDPRSVHFIDGMNENEPNYPANKALLDKVNGFNSKGGPGRTYRGLQYVGNQIKEGAKGFDLFFTDWETNLGTLFSQGGTDLLDAKYTKAVHSITEKSLKDFFGQKRLEFLEKHLTKDLREQIGPIGDALEELDGAKKAMVELVKLGLGDGLDTRTQGGIELFRQLMDIPGGDSMAYKIAMNPEGWVKDTAPIMDAMKPVNLFIQTLAKPNQIRSTEHVALSDTIHALEDFYHAKAKDLGGRAAKPVNVFETGNRATPNRKSLYLLNEFLKEPLWPSTRYQQLELAELLKEWSEKHPMTKKDVERLKTTYSAIRLSKPHAVAFDVIKNNPGYFVTGLQRNENAFQFLIEDYQGLVTKHWTLTYRGDEPPDPEVIKFIQQKTDMVLEALKALKLADSTKD